METPMPPPVFPFASVHPTSPPMTPGSHSHAQFPPPPHHTSPLYKRMGFPIFTQSPPLEFIEPIGQGPHFLFSRPQSRDQSSRPSTASGHADATSQQDTDDDSESDQECFKELARPPRLVEKAEFILEELDSDPGYDSDIEVIYPDHYEDARSESSDERLDGNGIADKFKQLHCQEGSSEDEARQRKYERKKKRWSAGIFKRTHSQSVEGDSSYSDNDPLDDVDSSARRLRRRVRGPGDRTSLIFEDIDWANVTNIVEVEEPDDDISVPHWAGPPSIPSNDGFRLDELPFWDIVEDSGDDGMEIEDGDEAEDEQEDDEDEEDDDEDEEFDSDSDSDSSL